MSVQEKNIAWFLPRPKPDRYKGGMPLYAEKWVLDLGRQLLGNENPRILNLFCGMNTQGFRVDVRAEVKPDLCCDAHLFSQQVKGHRFDLILADPPYSTEESKTLYGTGKLSYKRWTSQCDQVLDNGGILIVYHKLVMPNPNPKTYSVVKRVFIGNRPMHAPRVAIYFQKHD